MVYVRCLVTKSSQNTCTASYHRNVFYWCSEKTDRSEITLMWKKGHEYTVRVIISEYQSKLKLAQIKKYRQNINIFALKHTRTFFHTVPGVWNSSSKITVIICPCLAENILFARPSWFINKYTFNFLIYNKRFNNYYPCTLPLLSRCLIVGHSHTLRPAGNASERWITLPFIRWHTKALTPWVQTNFLTLSTSGYRNIQEHYSWLYTHFTVKLKFRRVLWASTALSRVKSQKHNGEARCVHQSINAEYKGRFWETVQWAKTKGWQFYCCLSWLLSTELKIM
jgi:hypothetical protein